MNAHNARPFLTTAALSAVILGGAWGMGIRTADQRRRALEHEETQMRSRLHELRETHNRPDRADPRPTEVDHALRLVNDALPPQRESQGLVDDLTVLIHEHGLNVERLSVAPMRREPAFCELPLTMRLLGTFESFYTFLLTLEASPQVMRVTGLDLRKVGEADEPMFVRMELSLFFRPND